MVDPKLVKCPFFGKRKTARSYTCEGLCKGMFITVSFPIGNAGEEYVSRHCYSAFPDCGLYRAIMQERYPDCADYYDRRCFCGEEKALADGATESGKQR